MHVVKDHIDQFSSWSGKKINFEKSTIMFLYNIRQALARNIVSVVNIPWNEDIGIYLGLPMING